MGGMRKRSVKRLGPIMDVSVTRLIRTLSPIQERPSRQPRVGLRGGRYAHYTFAEKLTARTVRGPSCWNVQGAALPNGYVLIANGSPSSSTYERKLAHRLAYELAHGPIPVGMVVMHACDNPRCVNPTHLSLGTQRENIHDAVRKGRWTARKLTDAQVAEIRATSERSMKSYRVIASRFVVSVSTVKQIVGGHVRTETFSNVSAPVKTVRVPVRGVLHV
jgi:HNH endonuclease